MSAWEFAISDEPTVGSDIEWLSMPSGQSACRADLHDGAGPSGGPGNRDGVCRHPGHPHKPLLTRSGDMNFQDCPLPRYRQCDHCRAGFPGDVAKWAAGSQAAYYSASYVGGGAVCVGRPAAVTRKGLGAEITTACSARSPCSSGGRAAVGREVKVPTRLTTNVDLRSADASKCLRLGSAWLRGGWQPVSRKAAALPGSRW